MTYEEAVSIIQEFGDRGPWSDEFARGLLDAIGYREMRERAEEWDVMRRALNLTTDERDAARSLADQLAAELKSVVIKEWWADHPPLVEWEARDWRPISPPGSGLDGLLTDINRESP